MRTAVSALGIASFFAVMPVSAVGRPPLPVPDWNAEFGAGLLGRFSANERRAAEIVGQANDALAEGRPRAGSALLEGLRNPFPIEDAVRYLRAKALTESGRPAEALQLLHPPHTAGVSATRLEEAELWQRLEALALLGRADDALGLAVKLTAGKRRAAGADTGAEAEYAAARTDYFSGKALLAANRRGEAIPLFRALLVDHPGTEFDGLALRLVPKAEIMTEEAEVLCAERLIAKGFTGAGREIFEQLAGKNPARYRESLADAFFKERRYPDAARLYAGLVELGGSDRLALLTRYAQSCARHDDYDCAMAANRRIVSDYPGTADAARATGKLGFLYFDAGLYDKSAEFFGGRGGGGKLRSSPGWYRFWSRYLTNKWEQALIEIKALGGGTMRGGDGMAIAYWTSRTLEKNGKTAEARSLYAEISGRDPEGYYGLVAGQRLKRGGLAGKTLVGSGLMTHVPRHPRAPEPDIADPGIRRAALLYLAGLDLYGDDEAGRSGAGMGAAAQAFARRAGGDYHTGHALKKAAFAGRVAGCDAACAHALAYPRAYRKYVAPYALFFSLDEHLAYAVMRQESAFRPGALSPANAMGLMQIIPPTAEELAGELGYEGFHAGLLFEPRVNAAFGSFYLAKLLGLFGFDPVYAIAAYNAGPEAVGRWVKKLGAREKDEFIELIPYAETHEYVKKVLLNYLVYQRMYGAQSTLASRTPLRIW